MTTATFSNGFKDTYKGTRAVKAAWAIIRNSDGKTLASGHSLDATKAAKTANASFAQVSRSAGATVSHFDSPRGVKHVGLIVHWDKLARKAGYADWKAGYAAYAADVAKARENVTIEIVAL